jgi:hypothetical protein
MPNKRAQVVSELNRQLRRADKIEVEYLRVDDITNAFSISRGFLFPLLLSDPPKVKSVHILQPGKSRGIRLVNVQSLRDYLATYEVGAGQPEPAG